MLLRSYTNCKDTEKVSTPRYEASHVFRPNGPKTSPRVLNEPHREPTHKNMEPQPEPNCYRIRLSLTHPHPRQLHMQGRQQLHPIPQYKLAVNPSVYAQHVPHRQLLLPTTTLPSCSSCTHGRPAYCVPFNYGNASRNYDYKGYKG